MTCHACGAQLSANVRFCHKCGAAVGGGQTAGWRVGLPWGVSIDRPVAADYDGDGRTDLAVFRPSTCVWYLRYSSTGETVTVTFGDPTDLPMPLR